MTMHGRNIMPGPRPEKMSREYGSNIHFTKEGITRRMQFRSTILYAGRFMDEYPIFHLYKHDILIDGMPPDTHSYRLAYACNRVFYPLVVIGNNLGQIIAIRNDLIMERWNNQKPSISRDFGGEQAERYIRETEQNMADPEKIAGIVKKDLFFQLFFSPEYQYGENERALPLVAFAHNVKINFTHTGALREGQQLLVTKQGDITDESDFDYGIFSNTPGCKGAGKITGTCRVVRGLDDDGLTDAIGLDAVIRKENGEALMEMKMQSRYLPEHPLEPIEDRDTIRLGHEMAKEKKRMGKKNFWSMPDDS